MRLRTAFLSTVALVCLLVATPVTAGKAGLTARAFLGLTAKAVMIYLSPFMYVHTPQIVQRAISQRLPLIHEQAVHVEAGALVSYGANVDESFRRAAHYVDRILKGAKPADMPIEQPTKFELVINLKTAKSLGLTIPPSILARADHVIQ